MPTTATVAPPRAYTGDDIASGLRALADLIETKPYIAAGVCLPSVPQHISIGVTARDIVDLLAASFDEEVTETAADDATFVSTSTQFDGLRVSVYAIVKPERPLPGVEQDFGKWVRARRKAKRMSQADLGKRSGLALDASAISRIESGTRSVRLSEAVAIKQVFGYSTVDDGPVGDRA